MVLYLYANSFIFYTYMQNINKSRQKIAKSTEMYP